MPTDATNSRASLEFDWDAFVASQLPWMQPKAEKIAFRLIGVADEAGITDRELVIAICDARRRDLHIRRKAQGWTGFPLGRREDSFNAEDLGHVVWRIVHGHAIWREPHGHLACGS